MPPLFVIGPDGKLEIVNYRTYRNVLIVDRLFAAAELRLGGDTQQKSPDRQKRREVFMTGTGANDSGSPDSAAPKTSEEIALSAAPP